MNLFGVMGLSIDWGVFVATESTERKQRGQDSSKARRCRSALSRQHPLGCYLKGSRRKRWMKRPSEYCVKRWNLGLSEGWMPEVPMPSVPSDATFRLRGRAQRFGQEIWECVERASYAEDVVGQQQLYGCSVGRRLLEKVAGRKLRSGTIFGVGTSGVCCCWRERRPLPHFRCSLCIPPGQSLMLQEEWRGS